MERILEYDTDYQPIVSKPTKYNDASNTQKKKKMETNPKSDTDSSHTHYEKIVPKPTKMEDARNKKKNKLERKLEADTDLSKPDNEPIVFKHTKPKDESSKQKNKLKRDQKANTESVLDRKPKTNRPGFQSLENKVLNLTRVKQSNNATTPGLRSENKNFTGPGIKVIPEKLCSESTRNHSKKWKQKQ